MADMHMPGVLSYDCSWTSGAQEICNRAIARHGGWTAWNQLDSIRMSPLSLSGLLPYLKGYQKTFTLPTFSEITLRLALRGATLPPSRLLARQALLGSVSGLPKITGQFFESQS